MTKPGVSCPCCSPYRATLRCHVCGKPATTTNWICGDCRAMHQSRIAVASHLSRIRYNMHGLEQSLDSCQCKLDRPDLILHQNKTKNIEQNTNLRKNEKKTIELEKIFTGNGDTKVEIDRLNRILKENGGKVEVSLCSKGGTVYYLPKNKVLEVYLGHDNKVDTCDLLKEFVQGRLVVIMFGLLALAIGIVLSSIPWLDYLIIKNLRLWNNTLSYHYWQKPGVLRLTKVFIFNVTNPEGFLSGEKPRLNEIGPFTYREDMQKVNVKFHDNGTVTYQHKKILVFMPELSVDKELKIVVPNVPLLTLTSMSSEYNYMLRMGLSMFIKMTRMHPFKMITAEELVFGYDDTLTSIANTYYPRGKRPPKKMGLLLGRNGTLEEVSTIFTGHTDMKEFGLINRLNGQDKLPFWQSDPCNSIRASEGSLFPPRDITKSDVVHVYDKDLCRVWPLRHRHDMEKDGIKAGYYTPDDAMFDNSDNHTANKCFCPGVDKCPPNGLQNISPCQYDAPIYVSFPHFYKADASLLDAVEGLKPDQEKHETYFKINPKMGVTLEAKVRVQMNLKVEKANINPVQNFRSIIFPVMWLEEGVSDLTPTIHRWVYLSTTVADRLGPSINYSLILTGIIILVTSFIRAYKDLVFTTENIEMGKRQIRRGSNFIVNGVHGQHKIMIIRDSYALLHNNSSAETAFCPEQEAL